MGWLATWCPLRCHCGYDTSAHCHHIIALGFSHESWLVTKFTESVLTTFGDCWCLKSEVWCQRRRLPPFPSRNSVSCQQLRCQYTAAALSKHLFAPAEPCRVNERETIVTCLLLTQTCLYVQAAPVVTLSQSKHLKGHLYNRRPTLGGLHWVDTGENNNSCLKSYTG